jgi:hypothetical protein
MAKPRQTERPAPKDWQPPRGITFLHFPKRPAQPYAVQWRVDGKRKTKTFTTVEKRLQFAQELAGAAKDHGLAALRLGEGEVHEWRAFRAVIGVEADLTAVAACWQRFKASEATKAPMTLAAAIDAYTAAKEAEGVSAAAVAHYAPIFERLTAAIGQGTFAASPPSRSMSL